MRLIYVGIILAVITGCEKKAPETQDQPIQEKAASSMEKLKIEDLKVGNGKEAAAHKQITVHYTGTLTNGKVFDSSRKNNQPFSFTLGVRQVIQGWDEGFVGMKVGGKRKLTIPPHMAYGERGAGDVIPPNSTLIFDVELLDVK